MQRLHILLVLRRVPPRQSRYKRFQLHSEQTERFVYLLPFAYSLSGILSRDILDVRQPLLLIFRTPPSLLLPYLSPCVKQNGKRLFLNDVGTLLLIYLLKLWELPPQVQCMLSSIVSMSVARLVLIFIQALREVVRVRRRKGLHVSSMRAQQGPLPPNPLHQTMHMSQGDDRAAIDTDPHSLNFLSQQKYSENRRVLNLIQDWCDPCRQAAWATLDREGGEW